MFSARFATLKRAYNVVNKTNKLYYSYKEDKNKLDKKIDFAYGMSQASQVLNEMIANCEKQWREGVLAKIEDDIAQALAFVYPEDSYRVKLEPRVLRGKLHIETLVSSLSLGSINGRMKKTQGKLFRQIVSLSSIISIMEMKGISTVYVDEAFSGASKRNIIRARKLLEWYKQRNINMIIIAQDPALASGLDANVITVSRQYPNSTIIE